MCDRWNFDLSEAPRNKKLLVWTERGCQFGKVDEMGQWRRMHNHPFNLDIVAWCPLPDGPGEEPLQ